MSQQDLYNFIESSQKEIQDEYNRIQARTSEDPGNAGNQGQRNWIEILRNWLPSYFHIVMDGRILFEDGSTSSQVDVIVLSPSYPPLLLHKNLYLADGVLAAFECKLTLKAEDITKAITTAKTIKTSLPKQSGSPYRELCSDIIFGVLAHSHSWKKPLSKPVDNITSKLNQEFSSQVTYPVECLDFLCIADLTTWSVFKTNYFLIPKMLGTAQLDPSQASPAAGYVCHANANADEKQNSFFPIGVLVSKLYSRLAWKYSDMRRLSDFFRKSRLQGAAGGLSRRWDLSIYSEETREKMLAGATVSGRPYDEWMIVFD